jgi:hypothetical protein
MSSKKTHEPHADADAAKAMAVEERKPAAARSFGCWLTIATAAGKLLAGAPAL